MTGRSASEAGGPTRRERRRRKVKEVSWRNRSESNFRERERVRKSPSQNLFDVPNLILTSHILLDLSNSGSRVQTLWTSPSTVENGMTSVKGEGVFQLFSSLFSEGISWICHPSVSLHENCWSQILILIPPVWWTGSWTTVKEKRKRVDRIRRGEKSEMKVSKRYEIARRSESRSKLRDRTMKNERRLVCDAFELQSLVARSYWWIYLCHIEAFIVSFFATSSRISSFSLNLYNADTHQAQRIHS